MSDVRARSARIGSLSGNFTPLVVVLLLLSALLLAYAAQLGLGRWQVDEYRYFADQRAFGGLAYFRRLYVSPRPFSEVLIFLYGGLVLALDRPLIQPFLAVIWGGCLIAMIAAAWSCLRPHPARPLVAAILGLGPMMLVMAVSRVTEAFYWPVAAVAYLPMAAALTCLMFLLDAEPGPVRRRWCGAVLLIATLSHEIGAAFAIGFAAIALLITLADRRHRPTIATIWWWLLPALAGLVIMLSLTLFRTQFIDLGSDTKPYTGHLLASAVAAARQTLVDLVQTTAMPHLWGGSAVTLLQRLAFAFGFAEIWRRWGRFQPNRWHAAFLVGLVTGIYFSLLAAYYHYGDLCCERHATTRQWLIELALILGASLLLARRAPWRYGPLLLAAAFLPSVAQFPAIREDLRQIPAAQQARARTWRSGLAPGARMLFYMPPTNGRMLITGASYPIGTYDLEEQPLGPNELVTAVGKFFDKTIITACDPWQTHLSYLVDGSFVPACPPHIGPPDMVINTH